MARCNRRHNHCDREMPDRSLQLKKHAGAFAFVTHVREKQPFACNLLLNEMFANPLGSARRDASMIIR